MQTSHLRTGTGKPLLLIHGLGGSARSWSTVTPALAEQREVIAVDLPGFGDTPPLAGETSIGSLSDAVTSFIDAQRQRALSALGRSPGDIAIDTRRLRAPGRAFDGWGVSGTGRNRRRERWCLLNCRRADRGARCRC